MVCVKPSSTTTTTTIHIVVVAVVAVVQFFSRFFIQCKTFSKVRKNTALCCEARKTTLAIASRSDSFADGWNADTPYHVSVCVNGRVFFRCRLVHLDYVMWRIVLFEEFLALDFFHSFIHFFFVCAFFGWRRFVAVRRIVACLSVALDLTGAAGIYCHYHYCRLGVGRAILFSLVRSAFHKISGKPGPSTMISSLAKAIIKKMVAGGIFHGY